MIACSVRVNYHIFMKHIYLIGSWITAKQNTDTMIRSNAEYQIQNISQTPVYNEGYMYIQFM